MHLASISSQEENDRLEKHIRDFGELLHAHIQAGNLNYKSSFLTLRSRQRAFLDIGHRSRWRGQLLLDGKRPSHHIYKLECRRAEQFPLWEQRRGKLPGTLESWWQRPEVERLALLVWNIFRLWSAIMQSSSCNCRIFKHSFLPDPVFHFAPILEWENFHVSDNTLRCLCFKFVVPCFSVSWEMFSCWNTKEKEWIKFREKFLHCQWQFFAELPFLSPKMNNLNFCFLFDFCLSLPL